MISEDAVSTIEREQIANALRKTGWHMSKRICVRLSGTEDGGAPTAGVILNDARVVWRSGCQGSLDLEALKRIVRTGCERAFCCDAFWEVPAAKWEQLLEILASILGLHITAMPSTA